MSKKSKSKSGKKSKSTTTTTTKTGGGGMAAKAFSKKRSDIKKDTKKGFKLGTKSRGVVSGRTRIGEVPDALNIYKGEG
jgi:hypothetical protein